MSTTLTISNAEIWAMLQERGYMIIIIEKDDSQYVSFDSKFSINTANGGTYSKDFSRQEIINDCIPRLLNWAALQPKIVLDCYG